MNSHITVSNKITQMLNLSSPLLFTVTVPLLSSVNVFDLYIIEHFRCLQDCYTCLLPYSYVIPKIQN